MKLNFKKQEAHQEWDSEHQLFYDDIRHVLQSTIDLRQNCGTDTVFTKDPKQQETIATVKRNLNDKLQVSNGEIHFTR